MFPILFYVAISVYILLSISNELTSFIIYAHILVTVSLLDHNMQQTILHALFGPCRENFCSVPRPTHSLRRLFAVLQVKVSYAHMSYLPLMYLGNKYFLVCCG